MYRYSFRFVVMTLSILTVNLLTNAISNYMISYRNHYKPLVFTLMGMMVIVVVFYPLFFRLESWVKDISMKAVKSGKSVAGKYLGLFLVFLAGLSVLMYFYTKMWYHIDILNALYRGNIGNYF
jgi:hypothetical protein